MTRKIEFNNSDISYNISGQGKAIVLLHGYLESKEIWNSFAEELAKKFQVIVPDLPGHGKSDLTNERLSVEIMAELVKTVLDKENVSKCLLVGHSMGGYATLAFLELYPKLLSGLTLFHSSPYPDTEEKMQNRDREINIIRQGKKAQIYNTHFPNTFAKENVEKFTDDIEKCKEVARDMSDDGIIAALEAMKARTDRSKILKATKVPVQYIIGEKDNFIPMDILNKLQLPVNSEVVVLENSGHMGFVEERENVLNAISDFANKIYEI
ncbi:MAG: alpha/beta hydrolase [Bacteroidetes bacterium]|nr:MAG: alpha/beta hydrolase [Bacteroidota bacterium]